MPLASLCHHRLVYLKCYFVLIKALFLFASSDLTVHSCHIIGPDLLMSRTLYLITYSSDGIWGTPCDPFPFWKRLQRWPSPSVAAAAPGEDPPQEQEAQSTPGAGRHPQAKGSGERKKDPLSTHIHRRMDRIYISNKSSFKWPSR